jgi:CubicO group peptidase (beta-lactamase class C family)
MISLTATRHSTSLPFRRVMATDRKKLATVSVGCEILRHLQQSADSIAEFLDGIINHPPVYGPYTTPIYSNLAYSILGLVYKKITGKDMAQGFLDLYHGKLGMNSSYALYPGPKVDAVIPRNDSYALFSYDIGLSGP